MMETPETNVKLAALNLLRFKMLTKIGEGSFYLNEQDVNEVLTVAGLPVIVPGELNKKELEVI